MNGRRRFLGQIAAVLGATAAVPVRAGREDTSRVRFIRCDRRAHIRSVIRREDTIRRYAGVGDNWHMTWAKDDRLYVSLCDGFGFSGQRNHLYNANMFAVEGGPEHARFRELPGYPLLSYYPSQKLGDPRYYPFGTLALDGHLYQFMSTFNRGLVLRDVGVTRGPEPAPLCFNGVKLIYSPDNGRTWRNQDGSTPVVWDDWNSRSRDSLLFFEEPQQAFSMLSVLQMGRNYAQNRDGYVYLYAPNGNADGAMNELVLCRVPKRRILRRDSYRYFAGEEISGARWSADIRARKPIHTFPRGRVNRLLHPFAWMPTVTYNAPLGLYMMMSWGMGVSPEGRWFAKPSYVGLWVGREPWGPWTQVHEEDAWQPGNDVNARAFAPQIPAKWIAPDGRSFWLVWTDSQLKGEKAEYDRRSAPLKDKSFDEYTVSDWALKYELFRTFNPYYSFNVQRVDLDVR